MPDTGKIPTTPPTASNDLVGLIKGIAWAGAVAQGATLTESEYAHCMECGVEKDEDRRKYCEKCREEYEQEKEGDRRRDSRREDREDAKFDRWWAERKDARAEGEPS